jgi:hypothetical protein
MLRRFVFTPACTLAVLLPLVVRATLVWPSGPEPRIPVLEPAMMPDQPAPTGGLCQYQAPEVVCEYRHGNSAVYFTLADPTIQQAYLFTYASGLTIGDLILAWGEPQGIAYLPYQAIYVYWPERSAFILTKTGLSASSRVGFIRYGVHDDDEQQTWRGFQSIQVGMHNNR